MNIQHTLSICSLSATLAQALRTVQGDLNPGDDGNSDLYGDVLNTIENALQAFDAASRTDDSLDRVYVLAHVGQARVDHLVNTLIEFDTMLREIRAENLDGSEPAVGELLESSYELRQLIQQAPTQPTFVGEDHPRFSEWQHEVAEGNTVLGLADWLDHNPEGDDLAPDAARALLDSLLAERAELAVGISPTCESEFDREGRAALARWDERNGKRLRSLEAIVNASESAPDATAANGDSEPECAQLHELRQAFKKLHEAATFLVDECNTNGDFADEHASEVEALSATERALAESQHLA